MNNLIENIITILAVLIVSINTNVNNFDDSKKEDFKEIKNIECYQLAEDGDIQITFNDGSSEYLNIYNDSEVKIVNNTYLQINNSKIKLNDSDIEKIQADELVKKELNKLPKNLLLDLKHNYNLEIKTVKQLENTIAYGKKIDVAGVFTSYTNQNKNVIKVEYNEVEHALNHEIGHALVKVWALHEDEDMIKSFEDKELYFGDYYSQDINEYIAEGVKYYYNNELPDSQLKSALDRVLEIYN